MFYYFRKFAGSMFSTILMSSSSIVFTAETFAMETDIGNVPQDPPAARAPLVSPDAVNKLRECSQEAYRTLSGGTTSLEARQGDNFKLFYREDLRNETNFAGFVKKTVMDGSNSLVVAFPGTRTGQQGRTLYKDVLTDLLAIGDNDGGFSRSIEGGPKAFHPGFAREVTEFWPNLINCINECDDYEEIFFTGHSKGGAIALLATLKFAYEINQAKEELKRAKEEPEQAEKSFVKPFMFKENFVKAFTFAAPAAFSDAGYELFGKYVDHLNVMCIYKNMDLVPYVAMLVGYKHVGIQANIPLSSEPVASLTTILGRILSLIKDELVGGILGFASSFTSSDPQAGRILNGERTARLIKYLMGYVSEACIDAHFLDKFSSTQLKDTVKLVKYNYDKMCRDRNAMGRGKVEQSEEENL